MLDLVGVQVRWDRGGTEPAGEYTLFCGQENRNYELGTGFFVRKRIISAVKTVVIVVIYHCYQLHTKLYPRLSPYIHEIIWDNQCGI
jgi:hypothetical protein